MNPRELGLGLGLRVGLQSWKKKNKIDSGGFETKRVTSRINRPTDDPIQE